MVFYCVPCCEKSPQNTFSFVQYRLSKHLFLSRIFEKKKREILFLKMVSI